MECGVVQTANLQVNLCFRLCILFKGQKVKTKSRFSWRLVVWFVFTCFCQWSKGVWHHWLFIQSSPPTYFPLLAFFPMPVSHFHTPFEGKEWRGERQINNISSPSLYSQKELDGEAVGMGVGGGEGCLQSAIENCCPYPERSVYTSCKVKQIDPGCRFMCATACKPPCLSSAITEHYCWFLSFFCSLFLPLFPSLHSCLCEMVFVFLDLCIIVCMFPTWVPGLDPEKHLGKPLADMEPYLKQVRNW